MRWIALLKTDYEQATLRCVVKLFLLRRTMHLSLHRLQCAFATLMLPLYLYAQSANYITIKDGRFYTTSTQQFGRLKGINTWYAPLVDTKDKSIWQRKQLHSELDSLKALGTNTLHILAGGSVEEKETKKTEESPSATQIKLQPLVTDKTALKALDHCLSELHNNGMRAIVNLSPYWEMSEEFQLTYQVFVKTLLKQYSHNETILAWQLCDTPYIIDTPSYNAYTQWCEDIAKLIKEADPNHLICASYSPLSKDALKESDNFRRLSSKMFIDFYVVNLSPYNQNWVNRGNLFDGLAHVYLLTDELLQSYNRVLQHSGKPFIVQATYPRDNGYTNAASTTFARNEYFTYLSSVLSNVDTSTNALQGIVFNGWEENAQTSKESILANIDLPIDHPKDKKAHYSIFATDTTTTQLIKHIFAQ